MSKITPLTRPILQPIDLISEHAILVVLRLFQAILLRLALALESGETGSEISKESLKETLIHIGPEARKSLRP